MSRIRENERSWAINLISDINSFLNRFDLKIKYAGGETSVMDNNKSMFPDLLLYADVERSQILQGWEIKLPDTPIIDDELIANARQKAISLGLNSFFLWNFTCGVLYVKDKEDNFRILKQWNETSCIRTRDDINPNRQLWSKTIQSIILELNGLFTNGDLTQSNIGTAIAEHFIAALIDKNQEITAKSIEVASNSNTTIKSFITTWWKNVFREYLSQYSNESEMFIAFARGFLLNLCNKIVFANLIKKYYNKATDIDKFTQNNTISELLDFFSNLTKECDFYNIFAPLERSRQIPIPSATWSDLMEFNVFLVKNGINHIEQNSLQAILEKTVESSKRALAGQFATPTTLAELLTKITMKNLYAPCIDPCCGTGTIARAMMSYKAENIKLDKAIETTWASDKHSFPLQVASISMTNVNSINQPIRIFKNNVFKLNIGKNIVITDPTNGEDVSFPLPAFTTIVSNLPFVAFESITADENDEIDQIKDFVKRNTTIELDLRSDIYMYIPFALWSILDKNGRMGIITSNSWLATQAGRKYYNALQYFYNINQVHISGCERWFKNADIVTTICILTKKNNPEPSKDNDKTVFCLWKKPIYKLSTNEIKTDFINSSLLESSQDKTIIEMTDYSNIIINKLLNSGVCLNSLFYNILWLQKIQTKLCNLNKVFNIYRGERRGWNALFYPPQDSGIEQEYLKPALRTSASLQRLIAYTDSEAFCCSKSVQELKKLRHNGALSWIERFEQMTNTNGLPLTRVLQTNSLKWYELSVNKTADFITSMNPDQRLFFAKFLKPSFVDQRLIALKCKNNVDKPIAHALLNSILSMFFIEAAGFGRGLGVLDINKDNLSKVLMLNPNIIDSSAKKNILTKFQPLLQRDIKKTKEEIESKDRIEFDYCVLKAFNIDKYYDDIKSSLLSMQETRSAVRR